MCRDSEVHQTYLARDTFKSAMCSIDVSSPKVVGVQQKTNGCTPAFQGLALSSLYPPSWTSLLFCYLQFLSHYLICVLSLLHERRYKFYSTKSIFYSSLSGNGKFNLVKLNAVPSLPHMLNDMGSSEFWGRALFGEGLFKCPLICNVKSIRCIFSVSWV